MRKMFVYKLRFMIFTLYEQEMDYT